MTGPERSLSLGTEDDWNRKRWRRFSGRRIFWVRVRSVTVVGGWRKKKVDGCCFFLSFFVFDGQARKGRCCNHCVGASRSQLQLYLYVPVPFEWKGITRFWFSHRPMNREPHNHAHTYNNNDIPITAWYTYIRRRRLRAPSSLRCGESPAQGFVS